MHKNCFNCVLYILISQPQFCCWPGLCWRWSFSLWSFCCQLGDVRFVTCSTYGPHRQAECLWMAGSTVRRKGERIMLHHVGQCWTSNDQCSDVFPVWRRMQKFHANGYIYFFVLDARMRKLPYSFLCCQNEFHLSVVSFLRVGARGDVLIYQAAPRDASMLLGMRRRLQDWGAIANMYETLRNYFPDLRLHLSGPHQIAPNSTKLSSERNWKQPPPASLTCLTLVYYWACQGLVRWGLKSKSTAGGCPHPPIGQKNWSLCRRCGGRSSRCSRLMFIMLMCAGLYRKLRDAPSSSLFACCTRTYISSLAVISYHSLQSMSILN